MYTININKLKLKENENLDSIIDKVEVMVSVMDETFWVSVNLPEPDPLNYTPLENITDEMVQDWVWENIDLEQVDDMLLAREKEKASTAVKKVDEATSQTSYTVREHVKQWKVDKAYSVGDILYYEWTEQVDTGDVDPVTGDPVYNTVEKKKFYRVVQAHTSQAGWNPKDTSALFTDIVYFGDEAKVGYPNWQQPQGAHDAYALGRIVEHNGELYISDVEANVWEPPQQWSVYTPTAPVEEWAVDTAYAVDDVVSYNGVEYTCISAHTSSAGQEPDVAGTLWSSGAAEPSNEWQAGVVYSVDDVVTYNGLEYICIGEHTSQAGWEPDVTPSLWSENSAEPAAGEWAPDTAYAVNDVVTYNAVEYTCLQAHTSQVGWEPDASPSLWSAN